MYSQIPPTSRHIQSKQVILLTLFLMILNKVYFIFHQAPRSYSNTWASSIVTTQSIIDLLWFPPLWEAKRFICQLIQTCLFHMLRANFYSLVSVERHHLWQFCCILMKFETCYFSFRPGVFYEDDRPKVWSI